MNLGYVVRQEWAIILVSVNRSILSAFVLLGGIEMEAGRAIIICSAA